MNVKKLWSPAATSNNIDKFKNQLGKNKNISSYNDLHKWSVSNKEEFWDNVWDFTKIIGDKKGDIFKEAKNFIESVFFNDSSLNYAENCLQEKDNHEAIIFYSVCFVLFRFFDIAKPFPVSYFDKNFKNSFGVIMDDVCAGFYVVLSLICFMVLSSYFI